MEIPHTYSFNTFTYEPIYLYLECNSFNANLDDFTIRSKLSKFTKFCVGKQPVVCRQQLNNVLKYHQIIVHAFGLYYMVRSKNTEQFLSLKLIFYLIHS